MHSCANTHTHKCAHTHMHEHTDAVTQNILQQQLKNAFQKNDTYNRIFDSFESFNYCW